MLIQIIGAFVALTLVALASTALSRRVAEYIARKQQDQADAQRTQTLRVIEEELEALESKKSNRSTDESDAYARLIRRRNVLVGLA